VIKLTMFWTTGSCLQF